MKELSIMEKAIAYDNLIERLKDFQFEYRFSAFSDTIERYFPELAESEDEKIRKRIIQALHGDVLDMEETTKALAWLEKQGKQNLADKVEPKFKVGDWVFIEEIKGYKQGAFQIKSIDEFGYNFDEYHIIPLKYEELLSKWSIKDVRDGDVLVLNDEVFIYAHRKQMYSIAVAHCFVDSAGGFYTDGEFGYTEKGNSIHPATKVQRDTLEKAMADAGYTFDFEKKKLKMIVDKEQIKKNLQDNGFRRMFEWSEEDNLQLQAAVDICKSSGHTITSDWLKSLKDRTQPQPKQEWSEEDERNASYICAALDCYYRLREDRNNTNGQENLDKARNWLYNKLKSLRPQTNITDEELAQAKKNAYNDALDKIEYHSGEPTFDDGWSAAIWYLKKRNTIPQKQ